MKGIRGAIIVAALGYFVDVYDLLIFSILRVKSLTDLGVSSEHLLDVGLLLLNLQMFGMLLGGVVWGVIGDKKGRISVLLGSILMYSLANIANGMVTSVFWYGVFRFIAGFGLAGELGAGITLVSELMPKKSRGIGTTIVASVGVGGAIFAGVVGRYLEWRHAFIFGGVLGLCLLFLRVIVHESGLFKSLKSKRDIRKGSLLYLISNGKRLRKYLYCTLVGLPIWFSIGLLVTFSPEFGKALGVIEPIDPGVSVIYAYIGLVLGDFTSGLLSQVFKSRKKIIYVFIGLNALSIVGFLFSHLVRPEQVYWACFPVGFAVGYWAVFVTNAAEQFGTNLRATVTTSVPNFIRGSVVPITAIFQFLKPNLGITQSALYVGLVCIFIALFSLSKLDDHFHKDLDFIE